MVIIKDTMETFQSIQKHQIKSNQEKTMKKYLYLLIPLILLPLYVVYFFKWRKKQGENETDQAYTNEAVDFLQRTEGSSVFQANKATNYAHRIIHDLGVNYEWFDPRRWSENDKSVYNLIKEIKDQRLWRETNKAYGIITKGRVMVNDLYSLLDQKYQSII